MQEEWKKVPYEGLQHYEVSSFGNVRLLPHDVETHMVNHGKDMVVVAHRQGMNIKATYDGGRPSVRMLAENGQRRKFSLPYLILKMFKSEECPGNIDNYTASYIDGDTTNNRLDNLKWVSKADSCSKVAKTIKGAPRPDLVKYKYIVVKVNNQIVGYFANTTEGAKLFNSYGFETSHTVISRALKSNRLLYYIFKLEQVSLEEYTNICLNYPQINLKMIYDMIMEDRKHSRKMNVSVKEEPIKKIEKPIKKPVEVKHEETKKEKKVLVNDSTTNVKATEHKAITQAKKIKTKLDDIDDALFFKEQEDMKKQKFLAEMKARLGI